MSKILNILALTFVFTANVMLLIFFYWYLRPYNVASIKSPAEVITKEVRVGDNLIYRLEGEVYEKCDVIEIRRRLVDGVVYTMETIHPQTPLKSRIDDTIASNIIPNVPPGTYKMEFSAVHRVNPIRTIEVTWETELFEVIE